MKTIQLTMANTGNLFLHMLLFHFLYLHSLLSTEIIAGSPEEICNCRVSDISNKYNHLRLFDDEDFQELLSKAKIINLIAWNIEIAMKNKSDASVVLAKNPEANALLKDSVEIIKKCKKPVLIPDIGSLILEADRSDEYDSMPFFQDLFQISRQNTRHYRLAAGILDSAFIIYYSQNNVDNMIDNLSLRMSLDNMVRHNGLSFTLSILIKYKTIFHHCKMLSDVCSPEEQTFIVSTCKSIIQKLEVLAQQLVYAGRNEVFLALPMLTDLDDTQKIEKAFETIAFYDDIIKDKTNYFDLRAGPIYNINILKKEFNDKRLIEVICDNKILIQSCRDNISSFYISIEEYLHSLSSDHLKETKLNSLP